jgi:hypothetical protein
VNYQKTIRQVFWSCLDRSANLPSNRTVADVSLAVFQEGKLLILAEITKLHGVSLKYRVVQELWKFLKWDHFAQGRPIKLSVGLFESLFHERFPMITAELPYPSVVAYGSIVSGRRFMLFSLLLQGVFCVSCVPIF